MKLLIDSSKRFVKRLTLISGNQVEVKSVESNKDILVLIDQVLKKGKIRLPDLTSIEAKMEGESRVGISIGVTAANALNYVLGLKKVEELEFPEERSGGFR